uniref:VWFA domain-containing protein n=1 Tax=Acrobeloides nanus TaxID=290746 RepID=A0A914D0Q2_9BILA
MGLLVFFLGLLGLFLKPAIYVDSAAILPPLSKYVVKDAGDPIGVPCTKNVSNAWLDIVVAIDISTNMGPSQITLQLGSELRKYPIGQNGTRYTRVAIITYATQATIVANLTTFSTPDQLYTAITGITGSTSDSGSDMSDAVTQAYNILYNEQPCDQVIGCEQLGRPAVFVLFAASGSGNTASVLQNGQNIQQFGSIITINYKPTDATLTNLLNQLASPSFNFPKSWTTSDLDWALTQCLFNKKEFFWQGRMRGRG